MGGGQFFPGVVALVVCCAAVLTAPILAAPAASAQAAPGTPTIGVATPGDSSVSVAFTPADGLADSFLATANPGGFTGTCAASPCVVVGLANGTAYTFTVTAINGAGTSAPSSPSTSVTPRGQQQITFTNPGAQNYGTTPTLSAASTAGLPILFGSNTPLVCTINSGGTLAFLTAGTCTITANQGGDGTWQPAAQVARSFTVNPVVPAPPVIGTATAGDGAATVAFTPGDNGGAPILAYTATANPGGLTGTCAASPCEVAGLDNGTAYTFFVTATNSAGTGMASAASNSVTPQAVTAPTVTGAPGAATKGFAYQHGFTVTGGPGTTVAVTEGTLPAGLALSPAGVLSGTPTRTGTYRFTVAAQNSEGTASLAVTMKVRPPVTVTVLRAGLGTVTVTPAGAAPTVCQRTCSVPVEAGTTVTLAAQPAAGWDFRRWGLACADAASDPTCTLTPTRNRVALAGYVPVRPR